VLPALLLYTCACSVISLQHLPHHSLTTHHYCRGTPRRIWPPAQQQGSQSSSNSPPPPPPPPIANPLERSRRRAVAEAASGLFGKRPSPENEPPARIPFDPEENLDLAARSDEARLLKQDPKGSFLLTGSRVPWLVRYRTAVGTNAAGQTGAQPPVVLREVIHRPSTGHTSGSSATNASGSTPAARSLVISSYSAATGELLARYKQRCAAVRQPLKVVAAEMTQSRRDLLLFCRIGGQQDDPDSFPTLSVLVSHAPGTAGHWLWCDVWCGLALGLTITFPCCNTQATTHHATHLLLPGHQPGHHAPPRAPDRRTRPLLQHSGPRLCPHTAIARLRVLAAEPGCRHAGRVQLGNRAAGVGAVFGRGAAGLGRIER